MELTFPGDTQMYSGKRTYLSLKILRELRGRKHQQRKEEDWVFVFIFKDNSNVEMVYYYNSLPFGKVSKRTLNHL